MGILFLVYVQSRAGVVRGRVPGPVRFDRTWNTVISGLARPPTACSHLTTVRGHSHRISTSFADSRDGGVLPLRLFMLEQLSVEHSPPVQFFSGNNGSVEDVWLKTGIRSIMKNFSNCCIPLFNINHSNTRVCNMLQLLHRVSQESCTVLAV